MASPDGRTAILISDLTVTYGPITALDAVSLAIPAGEIIGLVGHNGAGKSTLVNAITGAVRPTSGEIRIDGRAVDHAHAGDPLSMARHGMRVIHQEPSLAGVLSIADNITLHGRGDRRPRRERVRIAREALAAVGSTLDPERLVSSLGFGDRQVVDLARALLGDVKALLLDSPPRRWAARRRTGCTRCSPAGRPGQGHRLRLAQAARHRGGLRQDRGAPRRPRGDGPDEPVHHGSGALRGRLARCGPNFRRRAGRRPCRRDRSAGSWKGSDYAVAGARSWGCSAWPAVPSSPSPARCTGWAPRRAPLSRWRAAGCTWARPARPCSRASATSRPTGRRSRCSTS